MKTVVAINWSANTIAPGPNTVESFSVPANGPNKKPAPSLANSRIFLIKFPISSKIFIPRGILRTKTAKSIWIKKPEPTVLKLIERLLFDIKNATKKINTIPITPKNLSINDPL